MKMYEPANGTVQVQALNEVAFEFARRLYAPSKPSRLECVFATPTLAVARSYAQSHARTNLIYEIEPIDPSVATHLGDYWVAIEPHTDRYFEKMLERAERYWTVQTPDFPEVLIGGAVRVLALHS
jgi:hypothetical protein